MGGIGRSHSHHVCVRIHRVLELALPRPALLTLTQCLNGVTMASQAGAFISVTDLFPGDPQGCELVYVDPTSS
jgi:hypothetical protein